MPDNLVNEKSKYYYDQSSPFKILKGFVVAGSFLQVDLNSLGKTQASDDDTKTAGVLPLGAKISKEKPGSLDPKIARVMEPIIATGRRIVVAQADDGGVKYETPGNITVVRVFDHMQQR